VGNPEGKRRVGRSECRLEGHVETDSKLTAREGVDWIHMVQREYSSGIL